MIVMMSNDLYILIGFLVNEAEEKSGDVFLKSKEISEEIGWSSKKVGQLLSQAEGSYVSEMVDSDISDPNLDADFKIESWGSDSKEKTWRLTTVDKSEDSS